MSEENKTIEEENKEVETSQETISDEAMSNIKDSSTWIDALLVIVSKKPNKNLGDLTNVFQKFINQIIDFVTFETEERPYPFNSLKNSEDD